MTSRTLLMLVKDQGNDASWQEFTKAYHGYIYALIRKRGIAHEDAEELVQDVMVKVWKALGDFLYEPERCRFRTWLARICKNTSINFLKLKSTRQKAMHIDDGENAVIQLCQQAKIEENEEIEWQLFIAGKAWQQAQQKFNQLHLDIYSRMAAGESAAAVANALGIKENTAYVYRKAVQNEMGKTIKRLNSELDA